MTSTPTRLAPGEVEVRGATWVPLGSHRPVLDGIDLHIAPRERVLLVGPSGAGKSTLLLAMAGILGDAAPGELEGSVAVGGAAGLLVQDPRDARVAERCGRDVAFGCENAGMSRENLREAVHTALDAVGFPYGVDHPTAGLSGGEAQLLALAGVIAPRPSVLLLDEPTAMLDEANAHLVREAVGAAAQATDATLVLVEHRLEPWLPYVDRLVVLGADGQIAHDGPASDAWRLGPMLAGLGVWAPGVPPPEPLPVPPGLLAELDLPAGAPLMEAHEVTWVRRPARSFWRSPRPMTTALRNVSATVTAGRTTLLHGESGAGKSSLLHLLTGLATPTTGEVRASARLADGLGANPAGGLGANPARWPSPELAKRVAWMPQESAHTIVGRTVEESLLATVRAMGTPGGEERAHRLLDLLGLAETRNRNPYRLSGGERRRLALASALAHGPTMVAFDEPTVGQDRGTWAAAAGLIRAARDAGAGVMVSTHDDALASSPGLVDDTLRLHKPESP